MSVVRVLTCFLHKHAINRNVSQSYVVIFSTDVSALQKLFVNDQTVRPWDGVGYEGWERWRGGCASVFSVGCLLFVWWNGLTGSLLSPLASRVTPSQPWLVASLVEGPVELYTHECQVCRATSACEGPESMDMSGHYASAMGQLPLCLWGRFLGQSLVSLAGDATSIIFVTRKLLSRQTRVCHEKTCLLSRQKYACRDKTFIATDACLSRQKLYLWLLSPMIALEQNALIVNLQLYGPSCRLHLLSHCRENLKSGCAL